MSSQVQSSKLHMRSLKEGGATSSGLVTLITPLETEDVIQTLSDDEEGEDDLKLQQLGLAINKP